MSKNLRHQLPAYPPFDKPVDAPASDPDTGTLYTVCFNAEWLPYILGALGVLARPETYKADDLAAINLAAQRGSHLLDLFMGECDVAQQTLIEFDDLCGLQWSYDGGLTWQSANFENCARYGAQQEIQDAINDGTLQRAGGQPGPAQPPVPGQCHTYHVILRGADRWKLPSVVNSGDTIHVTNAIGGWTDGSLAWWCPDGKTYVLGTCGANQQHQANDPLNPGAYHMAVIGGYNTTTPVYFNPLTGSYIVPAGVTNQEAWLQANDGSLNDNQGQIEFDVEVCNGGWTHYYDFTVSNQGFSAWNSTNAPYTAGQGWIIGQHVSNYYAQWQRKLITLGATTQIRRIRLYFTGSDSNFRKGMYLTQYPSGTSIWNNEQRAIWTSPVDWQNLTASYNGQIYLGWGAENPSNGVQTIVGLRVDGVGTEPTW